jgi:four helix bundle protein
MKYKELDAWKVSMQLIKEIYLITKKYPKEELYGLTSQTRRAAVSISANIAEGIGRQYKKDTIHFLHIARGSGYELETLLNIAVMTGIVEEKDTEEVLLLAAKTVQLINGLINYMEKAILK